MAFKVWRDPCGQLADSFWWALCVSLLLHLLLFSPGVASTRLEGAREERGVVLHVSWSAGRAPLEFFPVSADDPVATSGTIPVKLEMPFENLGSSVFPATREVLVTDSGGRRSRPAPEMPVAIQEPLMPISVADRPHYFRRSELTRPPVLLGEPIIDVPDESGNAPQPDGNLSLRLFVSAGGDIDRAEIERSAFRPDFEDAVIAAFCPLHFLAGEIDGVAVNSQVVFEIYFDSLDRGSSRSSDQARW